MERKESHLDHGGSELIIVRSQFSLLSLLFQPAVTIVLIGICKQPN